MTGIPATLPFPDIGPNLVSVELWGMSFALRWYALAYIAGILIGWRMVVALVRRPALWPGGRAPMSPEQVAERTVRAQYSAGESEGEAVAGWLEEPKVPASSRTETFAALDLRIDNWRWAGVPFYLRTGKRLAHQVTEIAVHFRHPPLQLFPHEEALTANVIVMRIQPDEGISLAFGVKQPGGERRAVPVSMDFCYHAAFGDNPPSAYAVLLLDALRGDPTLFTRRDGVEAQWRLITPIEQAWAADTAAPLPGYRAGSDGPAEADALLARNGHHWRAIADNVGACAR